MSVLWAKRGWIAPGSPTVRLLERFGASDVWDFADSSYMRAGRVTTEPGLTVTRASEGYAETSDGRLLKFGAGVLRRTDKGVLVEGARTNLLTYSQAFDDAAAWNKLTAFASANAAMAPDGTLTADKFGGTAGSTNMRLQQPVSLTGSTTYTYSIFAKAAEYSTLRVGRTDVNINAFTHDYNLAAGTASGGGIIEPLANGWYRCSGSVVCNTTASTGVIFTTGVALTGDGTSGIYIWGAQLEAASFPSSYIPTEASAVTRAADQVTASLSGVAYPLSLYAEFVRNGDTGAAEGVLQVDASARAQRAFMFVSSGDLLAIATRGGTNGGDANSASAVTVGAITKGAGRFAVDDVRFALAGTLSSADTVASVPTSAPDTLRLGDFGAAATYGFSYIRRAAIFNTALSDADLQGVTT